MEDSTRDSGSMISEMAKDLKGIRTEILISGSLNTVELMVKESILGLMERSMMVSGIRALSKATEYGEESKMILT